MIIYKDKVFILTDGVYSDYGVCAVLKAIKDFDVDELLKKYTQYIQDVNKGKLIKDYSATGVYRFTHWLVNIEKSVTELDYVEMHTGAYKWNITVTDKDDTLLYGEHEF